MKDIYLRLENINHFYHLQQIIRVSNAVIRGRSDIFYGHYLEADFLRDGEWIAGAFPFSQWELVGLVPESELAV